MEMVVGKILVGGVGGAVGDVVEKRRRHRVAMEVEREKNVGK